MEKKKRKKFQQRVQIEQKILEGEIQDEKDILLLSGLQIARMIKNGKISSQRVVEIHIKQIKKVNRFLNAVVAERFELALEEAKKADEARKQAKPENLPIYWGVPCTVKETLFLKGMPNTGGVYYRRYIADEDATAVERLKSAGCIILGITNSPELAMWIECYNTIYGRTNNPYDLRRTPGGSSGGEGAIISSGASPFGLGSDIGGSIRIPAFFCGIFGHKPSAQIVPTTGHWPAPKGDALKFLTIGPLAKRAEDLFPLLKIISGPDGKDKNCKEIELKEPDNVKLSSVRIISPLYEGFLPVSREILFAQKRVAEFFKTIGLKVEQKKIPLLKSAFEIYFTMMENASEITLSELMEKDGNFSPFLELFRWIFGRSRHTLPLIILCVLEQFPFFKGKRAEKIFKLYEELKRILTEEMGDDGVMLYPPFSSTAPPHYLPIFRLLDPGQFTGIFNVLGFPSTCAPLGIGRNGLPLGVQIVGSWGNDHLTIRVANEIERAFGGWIPPKISSITHSTYEQK